MINFLYKVKYFIKRKMSSILTIIVAKYLQDTFEILLFKGLLYFMRFKIKLCLIS